MAHPGDHTESLERLEEVVSLASPLCPFMSDKDVFKRLEGPQTQGTNWVKTMKIREYEDRELQKLVELEVSSAAEHAPCLRRTVRRSRGPSRALPGLLVGAFPLSAGGAVQRGAGVSASAVATRCLEAPRLLCRGSPPPPRTPAGEHCIGRWHHGPHRWSHHAAKEEARRGRVAFRSLRCGRQRS